MRSRPIRLQPQAHLHHLRAHPQAHRHRQPQRSKSLPTSSRFISAWQLGAKKLGQVGAGEAGPLQTKPSNIQKCVPPRSQSRPRAARPPSLQVPRRWTAVHESAAANPVTVAHLQSPREIVGDMHVTASVRSRAYPLCSPCPCPSTIKIILPELTTPKQKRRVTACGPSYQCHLTTVLCALPLLTRRHLPLPLLWTKRVPRWPPIVNAVPPLRTVLVASK